MIRFLVREVVGWLLIALGLFVFYLVFWWCVRRLVIPGAIFLIMGIFLFRGGIHLIKVAVAARICLQAQDRLYPPTPRTVRPTRN